MKVLVTGATGLLGSNLVRALLADGYEVVVLLRDQKANTPTLDGLSIERKYGNINDLPSLEEAALGVDFIVHAAAKAGLIPARSEEYWTVNYEGTKNVVEVALKYNIQRLIHISTANSFGTGDKKNLGDETFPYTHAKFGSDYMDSKRKAQEYVIDAVNQRGLKAIVINPTFMVGKYDSKPSSGKLILAIFKHQIKVKTRGGKNYVPVRDAARTVVNALTMGRVGECYIVGGYNLTYSRAFDLIGTIEGVPVPKIVIPSFIVILYGKLNSLIGIIFGYTPMITEEIAKLSIIYDYHSSNKAEIELDHQVGPIENAMKECLDWMLAEEERKKITISESKKSEVIQ